MKNIKIVLAALVVTLFSSCEDAIDIIQPGELSPTATFQTVGDLQKALIGTYGAVSVIPEISFSSVFTDEVRLGYSNGGQGLTDGRYGFILNTNSNDAYSLWLGNYALINSANRLIEGAKNVKTSSQNELAYKNSILAQARVLRAWGHFKLLSYFSTDMTNPNALGVILVDHVPATNEHLPRSINADVFKLIDSDLTYAQSNLIDEYAYLPFGVNDNSERKYLSQDFIKAFKARYYAYRGQYSTAEQYVDALIASYPLSSRADYKDIWTDTFLGQSEVIFKLDKIYGQTKIGSIWASVDATISGSPFYTMSTDLYGLLNNVSDVRYESFVGPTSDFVDPTLDNPKGKIVINKYAGSGGYALLNDEKVFRVSEMYLLKAEILASKGLYTEMANVLQEMTNARFPVGEAPEIATTYPNAQAAWAEILKHRRIELCYEGHRYLDLKRLGVKANVGIDRNDKDSSINGADKLPVGDYRYTMPIPNDELAANPAIRTQQNPGYQN